MKNIHIIPTDKPSRLFDFMTALVLLKKASPNDSGTNQNIYITSDEEIKEGWILVNGFILRQVDYIDGYMVIDTTGGKHHNSVCEKIILTTDLDLIKDGVQGIPDDFLEWFVKNPSCEWVEVEKSNLLNTSRTYLGVDKYKILIPQEEPKQELERGITITHVGKQETLEEAAAKYVENELQDRGTFDDKVICSIDFIAGANWQAERMYSEEEVFNLCRDFAIFVQQKRPSYKNQLEWFEQFKKK
jgi:hypothetical protein